MGAGFWIAIVNFGVVIAAALVALLVVIASLILGVPWLILVLAGVAGFVAILFWQATIN